MCGRELCETLGQLFVSLDQLVLAEVLHHFTQFDRFALVSVEYLAVTLNDDVVELLDQPARVLVLAEENGEEDQRELVESDGQHLLDVLAPDHALVGLVLDQAVALIVDVLHEHGVGLLVVARVVLDPAEDLAETQDAIADIVDLVKDRVDLVDHVLAVLLCE